LKKRKKSNSSYCLVKSKGVWRMFNGRLRSVILSWLCLIVISALFLPTHTYARAEPPAIWLPLPVGEAWEVIQGYNCGTHAGEREIDFARVEGSTYDAPVRAAADGIVHFWTGSSGTLIIDHGNHYYTEYTHLSYAFTTTPGTPVLQGQEIGRINGYNHLHFSFYYSPSGSYFNRETIDLHFQDGYSLPNTNACNDHYGEVLVAKANPDTSPPEILFSSDLELEQWYCEDARIEFTIADDRQVQGFSQKFNEEPVDESPEFTGDAGYVQLSWGGEGMHTIYIRAWDSGGNNVPGSFGPIGYDATPPTFEAPETVPEQTYQLADDASGQVSLAWDAFSDGDGSGVAGYHYYLGTDEQGTAEDFSETNAADLEGVAPGCYVLRVQAQDNACGVSEWVTVQNVVVTDSKGNLPFDAACQTDGKRPAADAQPTLASDEQPTRTPTRTPTPTPTPTVEASPVTASVVNTQTVTTATATPTSTPTSTPTRETPTAVATDTPQPTATTEVTETATPPAATPDRGAQPDTEQSTVTATAEATPTLTETATEVSAETSLQQTETTEPVATATAEPVQEADVTETPDAAYPEPLQGEERQMPQPSATSTPAAPAVTNRQPQPVTTTPTPLGASSQPVTDTLHANTRSAQSDETTAPLQQEDGSFGDDLFTP
jgi:hypothetical protein